MHKSLGEFHFSFSALPSPGALPFLHISGIFLFGFLLISTGSLPLSPQHRQQRRRRQSGGARAAPRGRWASGLGQLRRERASRRRRAGRARPGAAQGWRGARGWRGGALEPSGRRAGCAGAMQARGRRRRALGTGGVEQAQELDRRVHGHWSGKAGAHGSGSSVEEEQLRRHWRERACGGARARK
jgi:hypothetical protein